MRNPIYARWQYPLIKEALQFRRIVILTGPRQCGKTTLAEILSSPPAIYHNLDDEEMLNTALNDPKGFVRHGEELMVIDEIQHAPKLLSAIKREVDILKTPGRFLLTGSANIQSLPAVRESLAGRVTKTRLRPLAYGEIHNNPPHFLKSAFAQKFKITAMADNKNRDYKDDYIRYALIGGYPEAREFIAPLKRHKWYQDYCNTLLERDLKDIINIHRKDSMRKLLEVVAAWSSKFIDISAIGSSLSLARPTIESYINALETLYLVERVRPWCSTDYDRVSKRDKLFMTDTGLMASILGWGFEEIQFQGDLNGKLIETFVFTQLAAIIDAQEEDYTLYHYRDNRQHEIDFIIQKGNNELLGIEVKAGSNFSKDSFKNLKWFKEHMAKEKKFIGIVLYAGEQVLPFGEDFWAVPINALWSEEPKEGVPHT